MKAPFTFVAAVADGDVRGGRMSEKLSAVKPLNVTINEVTFPQFRKTLILDFVFNIDVKFN